MSDGVSPGGGDRGKSDSTNPFIRTPAPIIEQEPSATSSNTYGAFTIDQLTQAGIDPNAWLTQYSNIFNPQGDISDLSAYYAGMPVATGYIDAQGKFVGNPFAGAYQAGQLRTMQAPSLTSLSQSQPYQDLSGLIGQMRNYQPGSASQTAYMEQMLGLQSGTYGSTLQGMNQGLAGGIAGMQGMGQEEKSLYQRQIQNQIDATRKENRDIMGALAGAGRSIAAYDAMETAAGQIADFTIQSQLELINNDWAKKQLEYQALKDQRDFLVQGGMAGAEQFTQQLNEMWGQSMQGYAQQISTLSQENQQYMQQFEQHAEAVYKSMMADIGVNEAAMNASYELYAQAMLPKTDAEFQAALKGLFDELGIEFAW